MNSFLSPGWFNRVKHAIDEGQRLGMIVDLTLGSSWPYGETHIPKEMGAKFLDMEMTALKGPSVFDGKIPWVKPVPAVSDGWDPAVAADPNLYKLVAVVAVRGTMPEIKMKIGWDEVVARSGKIDPASSVVLTGQVTDDHRLTWNVPDGDWLLFSFIQVPTAQQIDCAAGVDGTRDIGRQYVLDHMSKAALQKHIDAIGEAGKKYYGDKYGNGLRAIFCDSLEVAAYNAYWTDGFLDDFQRLGGIPSGGTAAVAEKKNGSTIFVKDGTRVPELLAESLGIQPDLRFEPAQPDIFFAEFQHGASRFYFLRNPKPHPQQARVLLSGEGAPEIWDAWTGAISNAAQYNLTKDGVAMDLHFAPYGSMIVAMDGAKETMHVKSSNFPEVRWVNGQLIGITHQAGKFQALLSDEKKVQVHIADGEIPPALTLGPDWFVRAVGKDKNGKQYTVEVHIPDLKDWTLIPQLQYFSGQGHYSLDFTLEDRYLKPGLALDLDLGDVHMWQRSG